ncbi:MAG: hypothetical protein IJ730_05695 [Alphaproteobacteria bacterium]|nr:hypothetical protein [Alphaproteobacteria bacterium]
MYRIFLYTILLFCCCIKNIEQTKSTPLETGVMGLSAASSVKNLKDDSLLNFGGIFSSPSNVEVEEVSILVDEDVNENSGVSIYFVACYDKDLLAILQGETAATFKDHYENGFFKQKFDDKIAVIQWTRQAKKDAGTYDISKLYEKEGLAALCGFIFVTYSTPGEHIYVIPSAWKKIKIHLQKRDFVVDQIRD